MMAAQGSFGFDGTGSPMLSRFRCNACSRRLRYGFFLSEIEATPEVCNRFCLFLRNATASLTQSAANAKINKTLRELDTAGKSYKKNYYPRIAVPPTRSFVGARGKDSDAEVAGQALPRRGFLVIPSGKSGSWAPALQDYRRSRMISRAALAPEAPVKPLPGCVPEPQRKSPRIGVL